MTKFRTPTEVYGDMDADIINEKYVTYSSENARPECRWIAYIDIGGANYLPVRYTAPTEEEAISRARASWAEKRAEREKKILARRVAKRKTAETKARKAAELEGATQ